MINHGTMPKGMMIYPPRPSPIGICKCGHGYTDHQLTDNEDRWEHGTWFQRNILFWIPFIPLNIRREKCYECMCPMYEQVKIIDQKTGIEIRDNGDVEHE